MGILEIEKIKAVGYTPSVNSFRNHNTRDNKIPYSAVEWVIFKSMESLGLASRKCKG